MDIKVTKVFSFTEHKNSGNPAGVVLDPKILNETQMKSISKKLHVSETAFLFPSNKADYYTRFFSPTVEVDLCGHATIAAFSLLGNNIENYNKKTLSFSQRTRVGILNVICYFDENNRLDYVMMEQHNPWVQNIEYDDKNIAEILHISEKNICKNLPKKRVSTGLFTLPVCVDSYDTLRGIKPDFNKVEKYCRLLKVGSFHVFTFDTIDEGSFYHARNFPPIYGISEDPVTGTANGAVCSYLKYCKKLSSNHAICEQGDIIGQSGRVHVDLTKNKVWAGGKAAIDTQRIISV